MNCVALLNYLEIQLSESYSQPKVHPDTQRCELARDGKGERCGVQAIFLLHLSAEVAFIFHVSHI